MDLLPFFAIATFGLALIAFFTYCARETVEHENMELKKELKVSNSTIIAFDELNKELMLALEKDLEHEHDQQEEFYIRKILSKAKQERNKYHVPDINEPSTFILPQN